MFTQRVDDAHGHLDAEEHEGPACSPESPRLHTVGLLLLLKNLLQKQQNDQLPEPKTTWKISKHAIYAFSYADSFQPSFSS